MRSAHWRILVGCVAAVAVVCAVVAGVTVSRFVRTYTPETVREAHARAVTPPSKWYDETYGTFTPKTVTGSGNQLLSLPATGGLMTFTTASPHYEVLEVLTVDGKYVEGGDDYSDEYGPAAQGERTAWNLEYPGTGAPKLEIKATGAWKLELAPVSSAPTLPSHGSGSGVFRFNGAAGTWATSAMIPAGAKGYFDVCQVQLNAIGGCLSDLGGVAPEPSPGPTVTRTTSTDRVAHTAGPSVVVVRANGDWTIK